MPQDANHPSIPPDRGERDPRLGREVVALWWELAPRAPAADWPVGWLFDRIERPAEAGDGRRE